MRGVVAVATLLAAATLSASGAAAADAPGAAAKAAPSKHCRVIAVGWGAAEEAVAVDRCGGVRVLTDGEGHAKPLTPKIPPLSLATVAAGRVVTVDPHHKRTTWRRLDHLAAAAAGPTAAWIREVALRPDGKRLALVAFDAKDKRTLRVVRPPGARGAPLEVALTHRVDVLAWSPDGRYVAASGDVDRKAADGEEDNEARVTVVDAAAGRSLGVVRVPGKFLSDLAFRGHGAAQQLVAMNLDEHVVIVDLQAMAPIGTLEIGGTFVRPVSGGWVYAVQVDPALYFQSASTRPPRVIGRCAVSGHMPEIDRMSVSPSGRRAVASCGTVAFVVDLK